MIVPFAVAMCQTEMSMAGLVGEGTMFCRRRLLWKLVTLAKAQQVPSWPWFLTGVIQLLACRLNKAGREGPAWAANAEKMQQAADTDKIRLRIARERERGCIMMVVF